MVSWSAVLARVLAIAGALYGGFVLVVGAALGAMDAGPPPNAVFTLLLPLAAVGSAVWGSFVLAKRRVFGAALFAFAALVLAVGMLVLGLRPVAFLVPAAVGLAAVLAWL